MMELIRSMPSPSGRLTSPLPRMPRVITPSMFWSRIRSAPSRQYALIASGFCRKLHMPFPPYGSVPPTAGRVILGERPPPHGRPQVVGLEPEHGLEDLGEVRRVEPARVTRRLTRPEV